MERDVFFYVREAMTRSGAKSERALAEMLGLSHVAITHWRRGALPNDTTMKKLAKIAGIDEFVALLDLNAWRNEGDVRETYKALLKKITSVIFLAFFLLATPANAAASRGGLVSLTYSGIYIITSALVNRARKAAKKALYFLKIPLTAPCYRMRAREFSHA